MRHNIVIFSHTVHSFLIDEVRYASENFDQVYVIMPRHDEIEGELTQYSNVTGKFYNKQELKGLFMKGLLKVVSNDLTKELRSAYREAVLNKKYMKDLVHYWGLYFLFDQFMTQETEFSEDTQDDWVFLSAWYAGTAFAMGKFAMAYPEVHVVSMAHSFEVDPLKTDNIRALYRDVYHDRLDRVSFISHNVRDIFIDEVAQPLGLRTDNVEVTYLGTKKRLVEAFNPVEPSEVIRIVTCSHMVPIKRLDLLLQALNRMQETPIAWTHIGTGEEMDRLQELVAQKQHEDLYVDFKGQMTNREIHEMYATTPFDMLINVSKSEGIPVSIMEAIAYGIPVIATNVGGNAEIASKPFGFVLPANPSLGEIIEAIEFVKADVSPQEYFRQQGYERFVEAFDADKLRPAFYRDLAQSN